MFASQTAGSGSIEEILALRLITTFRNTEFIPQPNSCVSGAHVTEQYKQNRLRLLAPVATGALIALSTHVILDDLGHCCK